VSEPLDERLIFVFGCPRSGTSFLARSLAACPGLIDLGEVAALKAAIPEVASLPPERAAPQLRRILGLARRLGLVGGLRAVEQTPETSFVASALALAFPRAAFVHIVRDGRDVACSLLERGWLSAGRRGVDDAGLPYGAQARFWVEPERRAEFEGASDLRRAAWAWRRYVQAGRAAAAPAAIEVRYERLTAAPGAVALQLASTLALPVEPLTEALAGAHLSSVGRYRRELSPEQLAEVEDEAGTLLAELDYVRLG
jgi:hypothetical protein